MLPRVDCEVTLVFLPETRWCIRSQPWGYRAAPRLDSAWARILAGKCRANETEARSSLLRQEDPTSTPTASCEDPAPGWALSSIWVQRYISQALASD